MNVVIVMVAALMAMAVDMILLQTALVTVVAILLKTVQVLV